MDIEKSLEELKEQADRTLLHEMTFTSEMEQRVWKRINKKKIGPRLGWLSGAIATVAVLSLLFPAIFSSPLKNPASIGNGAPVKPVIFPGLVWGGPSLWKASSLKTGSYDGLNFQYYGEKPVRIITSELYEDQGQKVLWLLNGAFSKQVELLGINEDGEKVKLGVYDVGGKLHDADGSFPSTIALPEPGIWKLQVLSDGKHFGSVFVQVKVGIMPANRQLIEPLLTRYLETNDQLVPNLTEWNVTIELIGVESRSAEKKTAYAWIKILNKNITSSAGINTPMAFEIRYDGSRYKVVSHQMPKDSNLSGSDIDEIFPPKYLEKIKQRYSQH